MTEKYIIFKTDKTSLEQTNEIYTDTRYPSDVGLVPSGKPSIKLAKEFYVFAIKIKNKLRNLKAAGLIPLYYKDRTN